MVVGEISSMVPATDTTFLIERIEHKYKNQKQRASGAEVKIGGRRAEDEGEGKAGPLDAPLYRVSYLLEAASRFYRTIQLRLRCTTKKIQTSPQKSHILCESPCAGS